jgi:hypothetical protein
MRYRRLFIVSILMLSGLCAAAKDKKKNLLPADVVQAQTIFVEVDPQAGMAVESPMANRTAQADVETALQNWGRYKLVLSAADADLIVTVRKGDGRIARPTIGGMPQNNRPVMTDPSQSGAQMGGRNGTSPMSGDPRDSDSQFGGPHPQVEAGEPEDLVAIYRGKKDRPLETSPVWRYSGENALRSPGVPAIDVFRKLVAESEKQLAEKP